MTKKCCVPGCTGNYDNGEKCSVFRFPKDEEEKKKWLRKISRKDWSLGKDSVVCAFHFQDSDVVRYRENDDGTREKRKIPKLAEGAFPCIFNRQSKNAPSYFTEKQPVKRKSPLDEVAKRDQEVFDEWQNDDKITNFEQFCGSLQDQIEGSPWVIAKKDSFCSLYLIRDDTETLSSPRLLAAIRVHKDMNTEVFMETTNCGLGKDIKKTLCIDGAMCLDLKYQSCVWFCVSEHQFLACFCVFVLVCVCATAYTSASVCARVCDCLCV